MQRIGLQGIASFGEVLQRRAAETPNAMAFSFVGAGGEVERRYGELDRAAREVAAHLGECARPGERVLILHPPGPRYIESFWGCLYAGMVAVPAYPPDLTWLGRSLPRLRSLVADAGARVALTTPEVASALAPGGEAGELASLRWLVNDSLAGGGAGAYRAPVGLGPSSLALLQYTSGSTGRPKGVMVTHENLRHNAELVRLGFETSAESVGVIWLPPYHDMGLIGGVLQPAYAGFPVVLTSPLAFLRRPLRWLELVSSRGATVSGGPDFAFDLCVRKSTPESRAGLDLSRWRVAFCGAEPVRAETLDRFCEAFAPAGFRREALYPCYGLAESTLIVSGGERSSPPAVGAFVREALREGRAEPAASGGGARLVSSGRALGDLALAVVDPETHSPLGEGREGEIWVSGPSVAAGYWQKPDESREAFGARLTPYDGRAYLRTGDLGFLQSGELYVTGRRSDLIIVRGQNHYPHDIEHTASGAHPALRPGAAAAFALGGEGGGFGVACELAPGGASRAGEALSALLERVAEGHGLLPSVVLLLKPGGLPKTSSGKVQRRACLRGYEEGTLEAVLRHAPGGAAGQAPSAPPDAGGGGPLFLLRGMLAAVLGVQAEAISLDEPAVRHGLDSLRAAEFEGEVEATFGVEVPASLLLRGATLRELGALVAGGAKGPSGGPVGGRAGPSGGAEEVVASEGQRALWFSQRLAPESAAYHVARAFRLRSRPDVGALGRALDALVDRHPSLRATFVERGGVLVERVAPRGGPSLRVVDARGLGEGGLGRRLNEEANAPFDLSSGPLFRASLFEHEGGAHVLFCFHHLVTDFWSLGLLASELGALYDAALSGKAPGLPPAGATPARLEGARPLSGDAGGRLLDYWRATLASAPPSLELPADRPRPRRQSFRGAAVGLSAGAGVAERVKALSLSCDTTIFSTLLAAFALFLSRATGERDVVVGAPSAGRSGPGRARAVGYFVNPLALRVKVDDKASFRELLGRAKGATLGALDHQALAFSRVVEAVAVGRDANRAPVVQAMLVFQSPPSERPELGEVALGRAGARVRLGGLELEAVGLERGATPFDLTLVVAEAGAGLAGVLEYSTDLFEAASAERMARHFVATLEAAVSAPDVPLSGLPLLDEGERRSLLAWADGGPLSERVAEPLVHRLFEARALERPDAPALAAGGRAMSYRELDARANRLARSLAARGVGPEARVGVCLERGFDAFVAFWAVLKAGGAYVPLEPALPPERLAWLVDDAKPALVVTQRGLTTRLPPLGAPLLCLDEGGPVGAGDAAGPLGETSRGAMPDSLAYVIYTSGSTGRPKGVMVTHRNAVAVALSQRALLGILPDDRVLQHASPAFDASVWDILLAHLTGACLLPTPPEAVLPGPELVRHVERERASVATLVPSAIMALPEASLPSLRLLVSAGEACTPELVARWAPGRTLINAYGPTEITVCASLGRCEEGEGRTPPVGRPLPGVTTHVLDASLAQVPAGAPGELCVGGGGVSRGYLGRPSLTAERFVPDPFGPPGSRLYKTGDRARFLFDGRIEVLGRLDRQVKLRGHRVEPAEIEACLREGAGVREASVVVSGAGEPRLVAYVAGGERRSSREMRSLLRAKLPESMLPSSFVWLEALPRLPSGKIDRGALPPAPAGEGGEGAFVAPRDGLEAALASAWAEALGHARVGARDHFFEELGGSSLAVVKACALAGERLGREVPLTHLFEHPTVEGLAERLRRDEANGPDEGAAEARAEGRAEARRHALARRGRRGG